ncbi:patatin-like phospholipase family protein [Kordiimonas sediminis]|nr:patatin-like phospholipase family protein [Kordiimonas sediminis]
MQKVFSRETDRLGIALGGGGAKGLAHIPILEVLDDLSIPVHQIAGTSIGAIIGAFYAAGMKAGEIRKILDEILRMEKDIWREMFERRVGVKWYDLIMPNASGPGLLNVDGLLDFLRERIPVERFEDLQIPLTIVASDFWRRSEVVFREGDILTAISASIALSGIFSPVILDGRVLVDGGAVNPVPLDHLEKCSFTIAVNVLGEKSPVGEDIAPGVFEAIFNTYQIMQESIVREKMKHQQPNIYLKPEIRDVRVLEFHKWDSIYRQAEDCVNDLRAALTQS